MSLGTEVVLGPGDIVLDGDPAPLPSERGIAASLFSAHVYCGQTPAREKTTISGNKKGRTTGVFSNFAMQYSAVAPVI